MMIFVPRQDQDGETRVALTPAVVRKLRAQQASVTIERGAGAGSSLADEAFEQAGAKPVDADGAASAWREADVVVVIQAPTAERVFSMKRGAVLAGAVAPLRNIEMVKAAAQAGVTLFAMEFVPRISRAQSMDVLSSQANLVGYKAVILAADHSPRIFPMLMTAAGTIAPAKVFVLGAGVAGLQAIATAKRLGAVVEAFDVRAAVKEQVQSLGARFVELPLPTGDAQTAGGYARELTAEERQRQSELMAKHVIGADVVITTAAVFGKAPPMLIGKDVVAKMAAGSVIVDIAADPVADRGNCELTQPGRRIRTERGVTIDGTLNLPALLPVNASQVYAQNMQSFLAEIILAPAKGSDAPPTLKLNLEDEIQKGAVITHEGRVVNEMVARAAGA